MFLSSYFLLSGYHQSTVLLAAKKDDFSWVALSNVLELEIIRIQSLAHVTMPGAQVPALV